MKPSMHGEESCLDISGLYLLLWPGYYKSRVSDNGQGIGDNYSDHSADFSGPASILQVIGYLAVVNFHEAFS